MGRAPGGAAEWFKAHMRMLTCPMLTCCMLTCSRLTVLHVLTRARALQAEVVAHRAAYPPLKIKYTATL